MVKAKFARAWSGAKLTSTFGSFPLSFLYPSMLTRWWIGMTMFVNVIKLFPLVWTGLVMMTLVKCGRGGPSHGYFIIPIHGHL